jgi:hypothetical protein
MRINIKVLVLPESIAAKIQEDKPIENIASKIEKGDQPLTRLRQRIAERLLDGLS